MCRSSLFTLSGLGFFELSYAISCNPRAVTCVPPNGPYSITWLRVTFVLHEIVHTVAKHTVDKEEKSELTCIAQIKTSE